MWRRGECFDVGIGLEQDDDDMVVEARGEKSGRVRGQVWRRREDRIEREDILRGWRGTPNGRCRDRGENGGSMMLPATLKLEQNNVRSKSC